MAVASRPRVSVVMPVYNAERYVAEAVASILAQTFEDFEFIIIDDGSSDGSLAILERYSKQDNRIRLVSRPNTGIVRALNEGLSWARGEFIARMDADDVALPERFARQVDYLLEQDECVAVGCQTVVIDVDGDVLRTIEYELGHAAIVERFLESSSGIAHPCAMMRRGELDSIGGYRVDLEKTEDHDLFLRLAAVGKLANLPDALLKYRVHPEQVSIRTWNRQCNSERAMMEGRYSGLGLPNLKKRPFGKWPLPTCEEHRKWAWWALGARNIRTARKHALRALRLAPFSLESWRVLACTVRGY